LKKPFLFNTEYYLNQQDSGQRFFFSQVSANDQLSTAALFNLFVRGQTGYSPLKAPFGSIEFDDSFTLEELNCFVQHITSKALELGLSEIIITSYPNCYEPTKSKMLNQALLNNGFQVLWNDANYHIEVNQEAFMHKIHRGERWKLRKSYKSGLHSMLWENPKLEQVYNLILKSRVRKGFELSLRKDEFFNMFTNMPEIYQVFGVWKGTDLAAVSVTVEVSERILYVFYTADEISLRKLSPVVMLHEAMYKYCQNKGYMLLDFGTASKQGHINEGVANFKRRLGGKATDKTTFMKHLSS
jgi:hypothetical protein